MREKENLSLKTVRKKGDSPRNHLVVFADENNCHCLPPSLICSEQQGLYVSKKEKAAILFWLKSYDNYFENICDV